MLTKFTTCFHWRVTIQCGYLTFVCFIFTYLCIVHVLIFHTMLLMFMAYCTFKKIGFKRNLNFKTFKVCSQFVINVLATCNVNHLNLHSIHTSITPTYLTNRPRQKNPCPTLFWCKIH